MQKRLLLVSILLLCVLFVGCGHEHTMAEETVDQATCDSDGSIRHYCTKCDYNYLEELKSVGHDYDEGSVITKPTCMVKGVRQYTCTVCGVTKQENIPIEHNFEETVIKEATCYKNGEKVLFCSRCSFQKKEEIVSKGHSFLDDTCMFCDAYRETSITPDSWYHYKKLDIVNMQNCLVYDANVRNAGNVAVSYYALCKHCHVVGDIGFAIVDVNDTFMRTYYCDCGERTTIIIKIIV